MLFWDPQTLFQNTRSLETTNSGACKRCSAAHQSCPGTHKCCFGAHTCAAKCHNPCSQAYQRCSGTCERFSGAQRWWSVTHSRCSGTHRLCLGCHTRSSGAECTDRVCGVHRSSTLICSNIFPRIAFLWASVSVRIFCSSTPIYASFYSSSLVSPFPFSSSSPIAFTTSPWSLRGCVLNGSFGWSDLSSCFSSR